MKMENTIKIPCKTGDKVYKIRNHKVNEGVIVRLVSYEFGTNKFKVEYEMPSLYTTSVTGIVGENLYLNRYEAEDDLAKE